uniref:Brix domain-containing protein n=1 Tax=Globodera rostochiensis TaxID=31243 RepID=A0A914HZP7_GLORO
MPSEKSLHRKRSLAVNIARDKAKRERREERNRIRKEKGEDAVPKQAPRTIENTQEPDDTYVRSDDEEVLNDLENDPMVNYFQESANPKVLITTSPRAKLKTFKLCFELKKVIPNAEIVTRKNVAIKRVVRQAIEHGFTDLVVVHEDRKRPNGIVLCHLPDGPTAFFKINSLQYSKQIKDVGESTDHYPELILTNFTTRLAKTISRMRVVTFHNQRDYVFFRHHRYEFKKEGQKAALHELGPRMTLRLKWLQKGTFDTRGGEYEFYLKRHDMEKSRRRFLLSSGKPKCESDKIVSRNLLDEIGKIIYLIREKNFAFNTKGKN